MPTLGTLLAAGALLFGVTAPAHAQEAVLVSNTDQSDGDAYFLNESWEYAQGFTTGGNVDGYDLGSVVVVLSQAPVVGSGGSEMTAMILNSNESGNPGATIAHSLATPTNPDPNYPELYKSTAPKSAKLDPNTTYYVYLAFDPGTIGGTPGRWRATSSDGEDSGAAEGWSIGDDHYYHGQGTWARGINLLKREQALKIRVNEAVNSAPTSTDNTVSTNEDVTYYFKVADFSFTDTNATNKLDHVKITSLPGMDKGKLTLDGVDITDVMTPPEVSEQDLGNDDRIGKLTYTPPADANGLAFATFNFKVNDGQVDSVMANAMRINVDAVNDAPTADDNTVDTDEDVRYTFTVDDFRFSDIDSPLDPLASLVHVEITSLPGMDKGKLTLNDTDLTSVDSVVTKAELEGTNFRYTPPAHANGSAFATFQFKVYDGIVYSAAQYTITIDVAAVNDAPQVDGPQSITHQENDTVVGTYTATDQEQQTITWRLLPAGDSSNFTIDPGTGDLEFLSAPDFEAPTDADPNNVYELTVEASDGSTDNATGTLEVTVTVTNTYETPIARDDAVAIDEDNSIVISVLDNDFVDAAATLSVDAVGTPAAPRNGSVAITDNGTTVTYTPAANFNGTDSFSYTVSDEELTDTGTVVVTVNAANDAPVATDDSVATAVGTLIVIRVLDNDLEVDGDTTLVVSTVGTPAVPSNSVAITDNGTTVTYTPAANFSGTDSFSYTVSDGEPSLLTDTGTVVVTVASNVVDLSDLVISLLPQNEPVELDTSFAAGTTDYTLTVENAVHRVEVTPTAFHESITVTVNGATVDSGNPSEVALAEGATTTITVTLTAEGTSVAKTYRIEVFRAPSANADLADLTISAGRLTPAFTVAVMDYTVAVANSVSSVTVTPSTANVNATVTVNGIGVASGGSSEIAVTGGATATITVVVTPQDGSTTKTYTIDVTRAPRASGSLPSLILYVGGEGRRVDASSAIPGNELRWAFASSAANVASVRGDGSTVLVTPVREGAAEVTATATNAGGSARVIFAVTVRTSAAEAAAIRGALAGQGRVVLGSVADVIGTRLDGRLDGRVGGGTAGPGGRTGRPHGGCGGSADGSGGDISYHPGGPGSYDSDSRGSLGDRYRAGGEGPGGMPRVHYDGAGGGRTGDLADLLPLLAGRSFALALGGQSAACDGADGSASRWNLWAAADLQRARGGTEVSDFDGEWRFVYLGLDGVVDERWLGGVAVAHVRGEADYTFADDTASGAGHLSTNLTGIYPYLQGNLPWGMQLWAIGGLGSGDVANMREHVPGQRDEGDLVMGLAAVGAHQPLARIAGSDLSLVGDVGYLLLAARGDGAFDDAGAAVWRTRLGVDLARRFAFGLEPFAQVRGRYDGGDGSTGVAAEMVLGLRYGSGRLTLEVRGNYLVSTADFEQWGFNARVGIVSHSDGGGLTGSLTTQWGAPDSGGSFLHGHTLQLAGPNFGAAAGQSPALEVSGEIGYGLSIRPLRSSLTPILGYAYRGRDETRARAGLAYELTPHQDRDLRLRLDIARTERRETAPDHRLELSTELRY